ncbi:MAG TPA: hypothetical protein VGA37_16535 [Gemmatimonadales bacterium]
MGILLLLIGVLAAASGALKLRVRARAVHDVTRLAATEVVMGALTVLGSGMGLARIRPVAWTVVVAVLGLMFLSGVVHVRTTVRRIAEREASEDERLRRRLQV